MKKNKTKIVLLIICLAMSSFMLTVNAGSKSLLSETDSPAEYTYENISAEKAERIFNKLNGNINLSLNGSGEMVTQNSILCIFGHSITSGTLTQLYHNYYTISPKCKEVTSDIDFCTRSSCDYFTVKRSDESRTGCH